MSQFAADTTLKALSAGQWQGHVNGHWNIGDNPNGGYLVAIALDALTCLFPGQPDPISITTHFLRPGVPDTDCEVAVELIRTGRTLSTARATLTQEGKTRVEVMAVFASLTVDEVSPAAPKLTLEAPQLPDPTLCLERSGAEQGIELPLLSRLDIRLHPDQAKAGSAGKALVTGYIRFADGAAPTSSSLIVFADAFPPSVFGLLSNIGWVPTVELTVHVRQRPAPGWVVGQFTTADLHDGRMVESGALWDSRGELVAQSRQIGLVVPKS